MPVTYSQMVQQNRLYTHTEIFCIVRVRILTFFLYVWNYIKIKVMSERAREQGRGSFHRLPRLR